MEAFTDGQLSAILVSKCSVSFTELYAYFEARDSVRAMCCAPAVEAPAMPPLPTPLRDTVPDSKGNTMRLGVCYVEEAA